MLANTYELKTNARQPLGYADAPWLSKENSNTKFGSRLQLHAPISLGSAYPAALLSDEYAEWVMQTNCHLDYLDEVLEELEKSPYLLAEKVTDSTLSDFMEIEFKMRNIQKRLRALLWN